MICFLFTSLSQQESPKVKLFKQDIAPLHHRQFPHLFTLVSLQIKPEVLITKGVVGIKTQVTKVVKC